MKTDKYIFFWGGVFSNFYFINNDPAFTSEKIFMAVKAAFFRDPAILQKMTDSVHPKAVKALGREIHGYNDDEWSKIRIEAMNFALEIKFKACPEFRDALRESGNLILVEASPVDNIWGIGFPAETALANIDRWGQNLLGQCLMDLRHKYFGT